MRVRHYSKIAHEPSVAYVIHSASPDPRRSFQPLLKPETKRYSIDQRWNHAARPCKSDAIAIRTVLAATPTSARCDANPIAIPITGEITKRLHRQNTMFDLSRCARMTMALQPRRCLPTTCSQTTKFLVSTSDRRCLRKPPRSWNASVRDSSSRKLSNMTFWPNAAGVERTQPVWH